MRNRVNRRGRGIGRVRLSEGQIRIIKEQIAQNLGPQAEVWLFGSRVDDQMRGGDIDLMVTVPHVTGRPSLLAARLAAQLERSLEGRRVDVVLVTPATQAQPIHRIARQQGVML
ncbi:MAG: nucleotidyltransferase domain-containing protein [Gammaproteobacteria bacterium]|nr:nucleotidyltransferase domain-containing protein [Gammaproteobacteria bacterium]